MGGLLANLIFAEAAHRVAAAPQVEITSVIILEGDCPAMPAIAVGLDRDALVAPEEIDGPAADANVDLRVGKAAASAEVEEIALEVAAGPVGGDLAQGETEHLRLPRGSPDQMRRDRPRKVGNGARGGRHPDPLMTGDVRGDDRSAAVQADPSPPLPASLAGNRDVDRPRDRT